ncbi:hypothetical protein os4_38690 (plasmid) [Comamonadaceae bacterium OS-4]|nr:hypothetical protein os4_38690 [Comamonadaceae bacterium OS-4]
MVYSVNSGSPVTPVFGRGGGSDVATSSKLQKCGQQLGDWVACPSGKTPEGKKIITTFAHKLRDLNSGFKVNQASETEVLPSPPQTIRGSFKQPVLCHRAWMHGHKLHQIIAQMSSR